MHRTVVGFVSFLSGEYFIHSIESTGHKTGKAHLCVFQWVKCVLYAGKLQAHSVLERIWIKGSYLSQWLPQGERGPPKES